MYNGINQIIIGDFKNMENMTFGEKLTLARKRKKLSKMQLCEITGIHWTSLSKYEHEHMAPSVEAVRKLAEALDVSTDYLLLAKPPKAGDMFNDRELFTQFEFLDTLPNSDRVMIKSMIQGFISQKHTS